MKEPSNKCVWLCFSGPTWAIFICKSVEDNVQKLNYTHQLWIFGRIHRNEMQIVRHSNVHNKSCHLLIQIAYQLGNLHKLHIGNMLRANVYLYRTNPKHKTKYLNFAIVCGTHFLILSLVHLWQYTFLIFMGVKKKFKQGNKTFTLTFWYFQF